MAKTLLEIYKMLKEGAAPRPPVSAAPAKRVDAKAQGIGPRPASSPSTSGTSTAFGGRPTVSPASQLGRVAQKPVDAKPLPMGGSVPGRQVNSTMIAAKSPTMQGRPAGSPTQAVNVNNKLPASRTPSVNAATGGANPTDNQRRAGMSITNVRDAMYGKNPTAKAAAGPTVNTGASGAGPVPNVERPRAPAPVPNKGMANSPLNQTGGAAAAASAYNAAKKSPVVPTGNPNMAGNNQARPAVSPVDPKTSNALSAQMRKTAGQRQGATAPAKAAPNKQPVQKNKPLQNKLKPVRKQPSNNVKPVKKGPRLQSRYQRDSLAGPSGQ